MIDFIRYTGFDGEEAVFAAQRGARLLRALCGTKAAGTAPEPPGKEPGRARPLQRTASETQGGTVFFKHP